jgi:tetratricopeptide (TPR) repeat protein
MNIEAINGWFYDDITARGVSFDGFLPQACKTPLGNIPLGNMPEFELIENMAEFELIHTPQKMADFQNNDWHRKNWKLGDTLLTAFPLQPEKHILFDAYRKEMAKILSRPCDSECCEHDASCGAWPTRRSCRGLSTLRKDLSRYGDLMTGNNDLDDGKFYDVKKEMYRLTDRVFAALAKCYEVDASGTFDILDELCETREIISSEARDNFASASAIAIKLRISTYLKAGKQGEQLMASSNDMPNEELCHFFFIAIPLYEELLQKFKAAGNIPPSLKESSFFDKSDVTMGHVNCRLLKYKDALECYDRALQQDPENLSIEIRRISVAFFIEKDTEKTDKNRENLDTLLGKIDQSLSEPQSLSELQSLSEPHQETTRFFNRLDLGKRRHFVEVLLLAFSFSHCEKYRIFAANIVVHSLKGSKYSDRRDLFVMVIAILKHFPVNFLEQYKIVAFKMMTSLIDEECVSTKSILWLNSFGELLYSQGRIHKAYRCFKRALTMGHFLYGTKPNVNVMKSLYFLGQTSYDLLMRRESKFYFELLVQRFESFEGPTARFMVKIGCSWLALLIVNIGYSAEKSQCYLKKGLTIGSRNNVELELDCMLYGQLAMIWHAQHNQEKALKSVSNAKACQENIDEIPGRVRVSCLLAEILTEIKETNKGIEMLKEEVQKLTSEYRKEEKFLYLTQLGKLCLEQGLASDAENYYKQALDMQDNEDSFDMLLCRLGISKAIMMDNRVSEAKKVLNQAFIVAKKLPASEKKVSFLEKIGVSYTKCREIGRARQCFDEAERTCKEESNDGKKLPIREFSLALNLGMLAKKARDIDSVNPEFGTQAERSHYDRAAEVLRQLVATGKNDTIPLFLLLAEMYKTIHLYSEALRILLQSLKVSEKAYGGNHSNETVTKILKQISDSYFLKKDLEASIKYRKLLIRMEMDLHLSNPCHEHISLNLTILAMISFGKPVGIDTVKRAYEFLLPAQNDKTSTNNTAKAAAARCFTSLGVLLYTSGDLEKAENLNEMASQLFSEIHESDEREKLPCETTCDLMKEILSSKTSLPLQRGKLFQSVAEDMMADMVKEPFPN